MSVQICKFLTKFIVWANLKTMVPGFWGWSRPKRAEGLLGFPRGWPRQWERWRGLQTGKRPWEQVPVGFLSRKKQGKPFPGHEAVKSNGL